MRLRRILAAVVVVVLAAPLVLAGALWIAVRTGAARHYAEAAVERATGHALRIGGKVKVVPSLIPTLAVDDVALLNPPGFSGPYLAHARQVQARVALLPLVRGVVEVRALRLLGPEAKLEMDAAGRGNWQRPPAPEPATLAAPGRGPRFALSLRRVEVADGALTWSSPGQAYRLNVPTLAAEIGHSGGPVTFAATASAPGGTASVQGKLGDATTMRGLDATVAAQVVDLAALVPGGPALHDVAVRATLSDPDGLERGVAVTALTVTLPQGDASGSLALSWLPRPALRGALRSDRLDADALLAALRSRAPVPSAASPGVASPFPAPAQAPAPGRLIPDTPLPIAGLRAADLELSYAAGALHLGGADLRQVQAGIHLAGGVLRLDPLTATSPGGTVQAGAVLDAAAVPPRLSLTLAAPSLDLAGLAPGAAGAAGMNAALTGQGATWRAVAASLGGEADVTATDGEIDLGRLGAVGDALRRSGLPVALAGQAHLRCLAIRGVATAGRVALSPVLLDAGRLGLQGEGSVNLGDETLDLHLRAAVRVGPAEANVPVHVSGTLAAPKAEAERSGGRFGLTVTGVPPPDACAPALAAARGGRPGPEPAAPAPPRAERPADLLRGLLR